MVEAARVSLTALLAIPPATPRAFALAISLAGCTAQAPSPTSQTPNTTSQNTIEVATTVTATSPPSAVLASPSSVSVPSATSLSAESPPVAPPTTSATATASVTLSSLEPCQAPQRGPICGCKPSDLVCMMLCGDRWYVPAPEAMVPSCLKDCERGSGNACLRAGLTMSERTDPASKAMAKDLFERGCKLKSNSACIRAGK